MKIERTWEEYKQMLESLDYDEAQISAVKEVKDNLEEMTWEQFTYLHSAGIVKRTAKLKVKRTLFTDGNKIVYLNHFNKRYEKVGYFKDE